MFSGRCMSPTVPTFLPGHGCLLKSCIGARYRHEHVGQMRTEPLRGCCIHLIAYLLRDHRNVITAAGLDLDNGGLAAPTGTNTESPRQEAVLERVVGGSRNDP